MPRHFTTSCLSSIAPSPLQALDVVQADLDDLAACCQSMGGSLAGSRAAAADLLHDTQKLRRSLQVGSLVAVPPSGTKKEGVFKSSSVLVGREECLQYLPHGCKGAAAGMSFGWQALAESPANSCLLLLPCLLFMLPGQRDALPAGRQVPGAVPAGACGSGGIAGEQS
jgi:hypothetical protein